jgi:signal recognition particle GTPase
LGRYIAIECKAPGKDPTVLQHDTAKKIRDAGGVVFVIDGTNRTDTVQDLENYLRGLNRFLEKEIINANSRTPKPSKITGV